MTGSLIVVQADLVEDVQAFADTDPYTQAGLFSNVEIPPGSGPLEIPTEVTDAALGSTYIAGLGRRGVSACGPGR
ncbi:MAG: hypothetical protein CL566_01930 [Alphaproteobacteria bacterium]|nr:hypothetical protein [Alphaproteobacteria bacterium]